MLIKFVELYYFVIIWMVRIFPDAQIFQGCNNSDQGVCLPMVSPIQIGTLRWASNMPKFFRFGCIKWNYMVWLGSINLGPTATHFYHNFHPSSNFHMLWS